MYTKKELAEGIGKFINNDLIPSVDNERLRFVLCICKKAMYENPDQNLQLLWHNLKVKYFGINEKNKLDNDWANVLHFISHPFYMQCYFRATLIKAQIYKVIHKELGNITENKDTADYLNKNLFKYGISLEENELIEKFTGEPLSSKAFCESLV